MFVLKDPIRGVINYLIKGTKINGDFENPLKSGDTHPTRYNSIYNLKSILSRIAEGKKLIS